MHSSELMLSSGDNIRYSLLPGKLELQVPIARFVEKYFEGETSSTCISGNGGLYYLTAVIRKADFVSDNGGRLWSTSSKRLSN